MMDTSTTTAAVGEVDFSTFVLDLTQSPKIDCSGAGTTGSRCCAPESRLSAEFENKMQKLINNFDLDDLEGGGELGLPPVRFPEPVLSDELDASVLADRDYPVESLDTTVDNEDDPLNLTEEDLDDSGDAGCSSDEQQQESRSLSLSYSLSISHAQENFSQYSQSTGLSKRYDSPCSYEDDRESECTNFDKLDDWSDLINDLHNNNNNNNVDAANREFKEYLDDIRGKEQNGMTSSTSGIETSEEGTNDTKEPSEACEEEMATEKPIFGSKNARDSRPDTPALERKATARENSHNSYLDYRDPGLDDFDDDAIMRGTTIDDNSNLVLMCTNDGRNSSVKRKLCEDHEDSARQLEMIVEKFQKTDIVPDHGQHASLVEVETFSGWCGLNSPNKTPTVGPEKPATACMDDENQTDDEKLIMLDGEEGDEEVEDAVATTPTNPRNIHRLFRPTVNGEDDENLELVSESDSQLFTKQRYLKKVVGRVDLAQTTPVAGSSRKSLKLPLIEQHQQQ